MKYIKIILISVLSLFTVVGGVGLSQIICHQCFNGEKSLVSSLQMSNCCCDNKNGACNMKDMTAETKSCCDESAKETPCHMEVQQIHFDWNIKHFDPFDFTQLQILFLQINIHQESLLPEILSRKLLFFANYSGPPLFTPKEYLSLIRILLI